jgi:hypothetical protein
MTGPDSSDSRQVFARLQEQLKEQFRTLLPDPAAPRTLIVVPSLSMDEAMLSKVAGVHHYEERMLCALMMLKYKAARLIYVTSELISSTVIDYFISLLPGALAAGARQRLTLFACHDASPRALTAKILARPRLLHRIAEAVGDLSTAYLVCFNVTELERQLALALGVPLYGCDPDLLPLGSKSGSRALFREAGLMMPDGFENLRDVIDLAEALTRLKRQKPALARAVVKLNEGFSGEGNAIFRFADAPEGRPLAAWVRERLPRMQFAAHGMGWEEYAAKVEDMWAVAEEFVDGAEKRSPSAQYRINPLGEVEVISTHEQDLGESDGQVFLGCHFPARGAYRLDIQNRGIGVARRLAAKGVLDRFGIDYVSVRDGGTWRHYAIEINLRKGGTTHPFMMLQYLTGGTYDTSTGHFLAPDGTPRYYHASDNIVSDRYVGLTPRDLIDIAIARDIHFDRARHRGVVFHLIGALSQFGKLGAVAIGTTRQDADALYSETIAMLDEETGG